jgi:signal peptidase I
MMTLLLLALVLVGTLVLNALLLWGITGMFGVERTSLLRALLALVILALAQAAVVIALRALPEPQSVAGAVLQLIAQALVALVLLPWLVVMVVFRVTVGKGALVAVCNAVAASLLGIGVYFGLLQFVQAFVVSSNNMAPTLLGRHHRPTCPHCGGPAVVGHREVTDGLPPFPVDEAQQGICMECMKVAEYHQLPPKVHGADRFLCSKLTSPNRWDLIVFRYPPRPEARYIERLVGLPGETVQIKNRVIWINGVRAELPADIRALEFLPNVLDPRDDRSREWVLGADEYFVLGDFSTASSDSRDWGPVPSDNIESVATLIYWPPSRWRILR